MEEKKEVVTDIASAYQAKLRERGFMWCGLWLLVPVMMVAEIMSTPWGEEGPFLTILFLTILLAAMGKVFVGIRGEFWEAFAKDRGWKFELKVDASKEKALMFSQSLGMRLTNRNKFISHVISGEAGGRPLRIFELTFTRGSGKSKEIYQYAVFEFTMKGAFPHMFLDRKNNKYTAQTKSNVEKIPLPAEFDEKFHLYAPHQYEIEALEIFDDIVLKYLLDEEFPHDVEIVDSEVLIFRRAYLNSRKELEEELLRAVTLIKQLEKRLDRSKLYTIGDHPHELKN